MTVKEVKTKNKGGRPAGSLTRYRKEFLDKSPLLLKQLMKRALADDDEAAKMVLPYIPKPKNFTEGKTLEGKYLIAKTKELNELADDIKLIKDILIAEGKLK